MSFPYARGFLAACDIMNSYLEKHRELMLVQLAENQKLRDEIKYLNEVIEQRNKTLARLIEELKGKE